MLIIINQFGELRIGGQWGFFNTPTVPNKRGELGTVTYFLYCNYFCDRKGLCRE
jgi:hypothetical protein